MSQTIDTFIWKEEKEMKNSAVRVLSLMSNISNICENKNLDFFTKCTDMIVL